MCYNCYETLVIILKRGISFLSANFLIRLNLFTHRFVSKLIPMCDTLMNDVFVTGLITSVSSLLSCEHGLRCPDRPCPFLSLSGYFYGRWSLCLLPMLNYYSSFRASKLSYPIILQVYLFKPNSTYIFFVKKTTSFWI